MPTIEFAKCWITFFRNDLGIAGLFFEKLPSIQTGEHSKIIPVLYGCPFYIVDHGVSKYDFNSYRLHKGQEDNLIFLGDPQKKIQAEFVDFRAGSPTLHKKVQLQLTPLSSQKLVIPQGVAHAFWGLEGVFTLNRPRLFLSNRETYVPAHDTHDWPVENHHYPTMQYDSSPRRLLRIYGKEAKKCILKRHKAIHAYFAHD